MSVASTISQFIFDTLLPASQPTNKQGNKVAYVVRQECTDHLDNTDKDQAQRLSTNLRAAWIKDHPSFAIFSVIPENYPIMKKSTPLRLVPSIFRQI